VTEERPLGAEVDGHKIGIFMEGSQCYALGDVCPHAYALLSTGWVSEGAVECPLHGARFELKTGRCVSTPPYDAIRAYEVRVEGGDIFVKLDDS
jgi:nitrite reductase/ring-hydroxylating ferredoxin subunit